MKPQRGTANEVVIRSLGSAKASLALIEFWKILEKLFELKSQTTSL